MTLRNPELKILCEKLLREKSNNLSAFRKEGGALLGEYHKNLSRYTTLKEQAKIGEKCISQLRSIPIDDVNFYMVGYSKAQALIEKVFSPIVMEILQLQVEVRNLTDVLKKFKYSREQYAEILRANGFYIDHERGTIEPPIFAPDFEKNRINASLLNDELQVVLFKYK